MGTYAESLLTPDEKVLKRERQHPIALILDSWLAIIFWGATIILLVIRVLLPDEVLGRDLFSDDTWFGTAGTTLTWITLLCGIIVVAVRWWWWRTQEFLVTNRRLVLAWGVLNKSSSDSSLEKINDAQLEISVLGRLLDYGTLKVMTAAPMVGSDYLDRLNHAKEFKKEMMTAKHELQTGERGDGEDYRAARTPSASSASRSGSDRQKAETPEEVTAALEQLAKLRDEGHLSTAEYEAKKQELLGRL
ncbi:MAG TPA: PH domain-containing protein [Candidatus Limnocylindrales bacterium]|nr:PH domain-containing protein [Candidatus Limnocylindrales bacterium]